VGAFRCRAASLLALLAVSPAFAAASPALAQGKLDARFVATLSGIPIGKGAWVIDVGDDQYIAAASGQTTGLLQIFAGGRGTGAARGAIVNGQFAPSSYAATISTDTKTEEVRLSLAGGGVKDYSVDPPQTPAPERVPLTDAHRRGVSDPMTSSMLRVAGNGDPLAPESCHRTLSVFDGRLRYDLQLAFKRIEKVKAEKGYQGPALVCAVYFKPVAGYIPDRTAIKFLRDMREMEIWFAPIGNTRVLAPFRFSIPTPLGLGVLQATQFVTTQGRAASVKTQ
jgi:hypothetical protein